MEPSVDLVCPAHQAALSEGGSGYSSACGCEFPIVRDVPRFVSSDNYAAAFGLQWLRFRKTQLDSYTGADYARTRLSRIVGNLDALHGKSVLEVGCGAGPFTEVLLDAGAQVFAVDLSAAVESNYRNHGKRPNYFVCQADVRQLPVRPAQFDAVLCIGVIQHTPCPEATIKVLCSHLKPGGMLFIDHYSDSYPLPFSRNVLRPLFLRLPNHVALRLTHRLVSALWPLHLLAWRVRDVPKIRFLAHHFRVNSPVVDNHYDYPTVPESKLRQWAVLTTFDALTDRYKHLRNDEQIHTALESLGLEQIEVWRGGNGVEARARQPVA